MKKVLFFILIILPYISDSQQPGFRKLYSGELTGAGFVDIVWNGEKLITSGQFLTDTAPNNAINGLLYMELDTNGNTLFTDIYFHPSDAVAPGIDNSLFFSDKGIVYSMNQILYDSLILLAIYKNSERINLKITPIVARQKWLLQCVDWNENILLSGKIQNYQYNNEGMLIKADSSGNEIWRKYYGSPGFDCYIGEPYIIDDTTIVLPGRKSYWPNTGPINNTWTKTWILTVDSLGNIKSQWESPKNVENGVATRMLKMPNGNWLYSTSEFVPMPGQIDDFGLHPKIVCRDNNFNFLWERYLGNNPVSFNYTIDLQSTSDGNYVVTGRSAFDAFVGGCFVYKFAPNGDGIWRYLNFCEPVEDCEQLMGGIVELPSGSLVAAGYIENFAEGKAYGLLIKLDKNGCLDTSCSGTTGTYEAEVVSKIKVYPNPSSDLINISNPIGSHIELWDMTGHLIRSVPVQGELTTLRLHDLPAGAYIVRMQDKKLRVSYQVIKP